MRKCNPVLSLHLCRRVRSNTVYMQTKQPVKCHRSHTQSAGVRGPSPLMSGCYVLIHPGGKCLTPSVLTCCTSRRCTSACSLILFTLFIPTPDVQHLAQPHLDQHTTWAVTQQTAGARNKQKASCPHLALTEPVKVSAGVWSQNDASNWKNPTSPHSRVHTSLSEVVYKKEKTCNSARKQRERVKNPNNQRWTNQTTHVQSWDQEVFCPSVNPHKTPSQQKTTFT